MQGTPKSSRLHIGIFGKRNSGKSSLVNALTGQHTSIVSDIPGTTTDTVNKSMELHGVGPVVFVDTAGFDDEGSLGAERVQRTQQAAQQVELAILIFTGENFQQELLWLEKFRAVNVPVIAVINKCDIIENVGVFHSRIETETRLKPVVVSAATGEDVAQLRKAIIETLASADAPESITGNLVEQGEVVMLVMPQDPQAPKGRLILPQAQTIRDLLDKKAVIVSCTADGMEAALQTLTNPPKLIITDSQVFAKVNVLKPAESLLTSFSVLFANHKGDINRFVEGAKAIGKLTENSKVLIAEACTHAPLTEDIGREKIPNMLRQRIGQGLKIDVVAGNDFPEDVASYDLIIHCGACMFNRRHVLSRISKAMEQNVPITNYGIAIAYLTGILDKVVWPD